MSKSRIKTITKEAGNYLLIEDNLYRRGKDDQLQMCTIEEEYVPILEQVHSGQAGGHFPADKITMKTKSSETSSTCLLPAPWRCPYSTREVSNGCDIKPFATTQLLSLGMLDPHSCDSLFTLVMVDLDAPSPSKPTMREYTACASLPLTLWRRQ
ncbi:hypothetical protein L7F22_011471 [Adiantum nelumboides]|nr:hypothetical protein [Adiantum nelumboides]